MTQSARLLFCWLLKWSGLNCLFRWWNQDKLLIVWYHGVGDASAAALRGQDERHIQTRIFRRHLELLKRWGYCFVDLDEVVSMRERGDTRQRTVLLTFDDGFQNVLENALPLMAEYGAKGVLYVVAGCARTGEPLWTDQVEAWVHGQKDGKVELNLGEAVQSYSISSERDRWEAIRDIKRSLRALPEPQRLEAIKQVSGAVHRDFGIAGFEQLRRADTKVLRIGSHTWNHPNLTQLRSDQEFQLELGAAKTEIEDAIGMSVLDFAYPAGRYNQRVIDEVQRYGYRTAVTTDPGLNTRDQDLFRLKRVGTNNSLILFEAMTSGAYFFFSGFVKPLRPSRYN